MVVFQLVTKQPHGTYQEIHYQMQSKLQLLLLLEHQLAQIRDSEEDMQILKSLRFLNLEQKFYYHLDT